MAHNGRVSDFNAQIIDEFRANSGFVQTAGFGRNLILLHTVCLLYTSPSPRD